jgi:hypothetical protein
MNQVLSKPVEVKILKKLVSQLGYLDHIELQRMQSIKDKQINQLIQYIDKSKCLDIEQRENKFLEYVNQKIEEDQMKEYISRVKTFID